MSLVEFDFEHVVQEGKDVMFRVRGTAYSDGTASLSMNAYRIKRRTEKGVWLDLYGNEEKFVLNYGRKRYAYPTKQEALDAFVERKKAQIRILQGLLNGAVKQLEKAKESVAEDLPTW